MHDEAKTIFKRSQMLYFMIKTLDIIFYEILYTVYTVVYSISYVLLKK